VELKRKVEEIIPHRRIAELVQLIVERNPQNVSKEFTISVLVYITLNFKQLNISDLQDDEDFVI
jgi:hypothetical protein